LIPGDATLVVEVNGNEIFAKSGLNTPDEYNFFSVMKLMGGESASFVESFLKGSKEAGINAEKILFYVSKLPDFTVHIPVVDKAAFEGWLKKSNSPEPVTEGNFSYIPIADGVNIAWNDALAIVSSASSREQIAELFKSKKDGLLATSDDFKEFAKKNADIRLWARYEFLIDSYKNLTVLNTGRRFDSEDTEKLFLNMEDFKKLSTHSYLNFEDGKIVGTASGYPPEEIDRLYKKYPIIKESFNAGLIKDMPEQSYLAFNIFINVVEYTKLIRQNIETILSNGSVDDSEFEEKSEELFKLFDSSELKSIVDALDGDVLVNIHGFNKGFFTYPLASAGFTVKGEEAFNSILKLIPQNFYRKQDGYYTISVEQTFIPVYFAYRDGRVFVSNDLTAVKAFTGGQQEKTFADNPAGKIMTDKMLFYINLDYDTYPDHVKMLVQNFMGKEYKYFTSSIELYEYVYFAGDKYTVNFTLQLKNKNVNSLKQIFKNIDKTTASLWTN
jgi:hypothetical protein